MDFRGFPEDGLAFLRDLSRHNHRDWFEGHREVWDARIVPATQRSSWNAGTTTHSLTGSPPAGRG